MVQLCPLGTITAFRTHATFAPKAFCRHKSITAAIERGKQKHSTTRATRSFDNTSSGRSSRRASKLSPSTPSPSLRFRPVPRGEWKERTTHQQRQQREDEERIQRHLQSIAPAALSYTTAASEFLYGYSTVLAAIKAGRRKFYKLYIHSRGMNNVGKDGIKQRARALGVDIQEVGDNYLQALDKASSGRPHNVSANFYSSSFTLKLMIIGFRIRVLPTTGPSDNRIGLLFRSVRNVSSYPG